MYNLCESRGVYLLFYLSTASLWLSNVHQYFPSQGFAYGKVEKLYEREQGEWDEFNQGYERHRSMGHEQGQWYIFLNVVHIGVT